MCRINHFNEIFQGTEVTLVAGDRNNQSALLWKVLSVFD